MLTSKQRAILRKEAQALPVVFQVGKGEIDEALVKSTAECLAARELIKMKVLENSMYTPREAADTLAEKTGADCVQVIGSKFVLYLQKKKESKYAALLKGWAMEKLLLFGGTFDPPHNGHMALLSACLAAVRPHRALVMPAGVPPHKQASATPGPLRAEMCGCFKALSPCVEVSRWELGQGGRNYTVDTLRMLKNAFPGARLHLCLGSDMLLSFCEWRCWREILRLSALVVHSRENGDGPALSAAAQALEAQGAEVIFAPGTVLEISSTQVRALAARGGDISHLVPPGVRRVILREGLYCGGAHIIHKEARGH